MLQALSKRKPINNIIKYDHVKIYSSCYQWRVIKLHVRVSVRLRVRVRAKTF